MSETDTDASDGLPDLLERASEIVRDVEDEEEGIPDPLQDVATRVHDLVESSDAGDLVEAAGVDLPDAADPGSIAEAISQGDEASVRRLRTVLLLSDLAEADDEEARSSIVSDLRDVGSRVADTDDEPSSPEADDVDVRSDEEESPDEQTSVLQEQLETELTDAIEEFRGTVDALREELDLEAGSEQQTESEDAADEEQTDDEDADERGGDAGAGRPRFTHGMYSTVPGRRRDGPPATTTLSTVRGKSRTQ